MPIYLIVFVVAWVVAQGSKYLLESYKNKKASFKTIITESGGMPSSHSAVVIAITTLIALREGVHSSIFGITFAFAMIVIYDSMKVRYTNGVQGETINNIISKNKINIPKVRVVKGHTPLEVAVGIAIGVIIGYVSFIIFHSINI